MQGQELKHKAGRGTEEMGNIDLSDYLTVLAHTILTHHSSHKISGGCLQGSPYHILPGAPLASPGNSRGQDEGLECVNDAVGVEVVDGDRGGPNTSLVAGGAPERLVAEEGHDEGRLAF